MDLSRLREEQTHIMRSFRFADVQTNVDLCLWCVWSRLFHQSRQRTCIECVWKNKRRKDCCATDLPVTLLRPFLTRCRARSLLPLLYSINSQFLP